MQDGAFRGRIKVSILKYAAYILGEAATTPAHNTRVKWSQGVFAQPDQEAGRIQPPVVMDEKVQTSGSAITDADLQLAVESTVNTIL